MADKHILNNIDLHGNKVKNYSADHWTTFPSSPFVGQRGYYLPWNAEVYWNGTEWIRTDGDIKDITVNAPLTKSTPQTGVVDLDITDATPSARGTMSAADKQKLDAATDTNTFDTIVMRDSAGRFSATQITLSGQPVNPTDLVRKVDLDQYSLGLDWQNDVLDIVDNTFDPGTSPADGDRYIITTATYHSNFGTISGFEVNDIVEYDADAGAWVVAYDVSNAGPVAFAPNRADGMVYQWTGTSWVISSAFTNIVGGDGLTMSGNVLNVGGGPGIQVNPDSIEVVGDNVSIEVDAVQGVRVKDSGITAAKLSSSALGTGLSGGDGAPASVVGYTPVSGATIARKRVFSNVIVGGGVGPQQLAHNLGTQDVIVIGRDGSGNIYELGWVPTNANTVTVDASSSAQFTLEITVIG